MLWPVLCFITPRLVTACQWYDHSKLTRAFSSSTSLLKMLSSKSHNWIEVVSTWKLVCPMGCFTLVLVAIVIIYTLYYFLMIHCKVFLFDITIWYSQIRLIHIHKYFLWNYPGNTTCAEHINWAKQPDTFSIEFFSETVRGNLFTQDLNGIRPIIRQSDSPTVR